ncbi:MAG: hypothetical protein HUU35_18235 [Armatimonadetes bacterium]|nr:hypothetical protein [Armatimonadota bacterium]
MCNGEQDLLERILEDEGLVAGLPLEASEAIRAWCVDRVSEAWRREGLAFASDYADELVAAARVVTEAFIELQTGVSARRIAARLGKVVADGEQALDTLTSARPLPERLRDVLDRVTLPGHLRRAS